MSLLPSPTGHADRPRRPGPHPDLADPKTAVKMLDAELKGAGPWFPAFSPLAERLGAGEGLMLSALVNVALKFVGSDGWFKLGVEFAKKKTGLSAKGQARTLAKLAARGLIEIEHRGDDRFVRLYFGRVRALARGAA
jgi:hypothetical protein